MTAHCHDTFSLLDGIGMPLDHALAAKQCGLKGLAQTNHGNTAGWYKWDKQLREEGINPLFGIEAYQTPDRHQKDKDSITAHLVLLAKSQEGLKNINRISSRASSEGFYGKPRCDYEILEEHSEGIIATSACVSGMVGKYLQIGDHARARDHLIRMQNIFGENFYLELQPHPFDLQDDLNKFLLGFADPNGGNFGYVVASDSHYPFKEDKPHHDVAVCIATKKKVSDERRMRYEYAHHIRGFDELYEEFSQRGFESRYIESAIENTSRILETTRVELPRNLSLMPGWDNAPVVLKEHLGKGARCRFEDTVSESKWKEYAERLRYEYEIIDNKGFCEYFLMNEDLVQGARERGVSIGPGRGSASGSLISYLLGITEVDPVFWNLSFERFLSPDRDDPPDIDTDYSDRTPVVQYAREKYGTAHVCYVSNYTLLKGVSALRDVTSATEVMVPKRMKDDVEELGSVKKYIEEGFDCYLDPLDPLLASLHTAARLEGNVRHTGVTAAGVIVSKEPITDYSATYMKDGDPVSVYDKRDLEEIGFVKMDVLRVSNIATINKCLELIEERGGTPPDNIWKLPLEDKRMMNEFRKGHTDLIFQYGGGATKDLLLRAQPETVHDLIAINALSRPGPDDNVYIKRKKNKKPIYPPQVDKFLQKTRGMIVFQEDFMAICREVAGMEGKDVYRVRKMSGKKDRSEVKELSKIFIRGCQKHSGIDSETAAKIWSDIEPFAEYGFGFAHSVSYFVTAWADMYLQVYHPFEWILANLSINYSDDRRSLILHEASNLGIDISSVDINRSKYDWSYDGDTLIPGLRFIVGVGEAMARKISDRASKSPFIGGEEYQIPKTKEKTESRFRLLQEDGGTLKVNKNTYEALSRAGAIPEQMGDPIQIRVSSGLPVDVTSGMDINPLWNARPLSELKSKLICVSAYVKNCRKASRGDYTLNLQGDIADVVYSHNQLDAGSYLLIIDGGKYRHVYAAIPVQKAARHPMDRDFEDIDVFDKRKKKGAAYLFAGKKAKTSYITVALTPEPRILWMDDNIEEGYYHLKYKEPGRKWECVPLNNIANAIRRKELVDV